MRESCSGNLGPFPVGNWPRGLRWVSDLSFNNFTAAYAGGADADTFCHALDLGPHGAKVNVPAAPGHVMGVTNDVAKTRLLAANLTNLCHQRLQVGSISSSESLILLNFAEFRHRKKAFSPNRVVGGFRTAHERHSIARRAGRWPTKHFFYHLRNLHIADP